MTKIQTHRSQITASLLVKKRTIHVALDREPGQKGNVNFTEASGALNEEEALSLSRYLRNWLKEMHEKLLPEVPIPKDLVKEVIKNQYFKALLSGEWSSGNITLTSFSQTLASLRDKKNLSQRVVALEAGITEAAFQNLENMRSGKSYIKILKLCKLLSIEPKDVKSQNLTSLLKSRNIKQSECSKELGVTETAIQQMTRRIKEDSDSTLNILIKIFDQLKCEVKDFIPSN